MIKVKDRNIPWREGMTVADLIRELDDPYPYVVVVMNGKTVTEPNFGSTNVPDHCEVRLIPMIVGG